MVYLQKQEQSKAHETFARQGGHTWFNDKTQSTDLSYRYQP
jgi:hypothetical protein